MRQVQEIRGGVGSDADAREAEG